MDLPFGTLRFKIGGGHGGHNGLRSTDAKITPEYARIRMGIGKPEHKGEISSYVLSDFNEQEKKHLKVWIEQAADAVEELLEKSLQDVSAIHTIKNFELK